MLKMHLVLLGKVKMLKVIIYKVGENLKQIDMDLPRELYKFFDMNPSECVTGNLRILQDALLG